MEVYKYFRGQAEVHPTDDSQLCLLCLEPLATKRPCCNAMFCDHCYTKNSQCPNCDVLTRKEKLTGATYVLQGFSEHEECRICLDPGLKRRCCNNFYCDDCYYRHATCRSCGSPVGVSEYENLSFMPANCFVLLLGWTVTVSLTVIFVAFFLTVIVNEVATPVGLYDYKCYGFFRSCDVPVCIGMPSTVADGSAPLPPLSQWEACTLDSVVKLQSDACIFDNILYRSSDKTQGYDVCVESFEPGVYVFEDTFENWANESFVSNAMVSATWDDIVNGDVTPYCGVGEVFGGEFSLSFAGEQLRYAETKDMDLTSGGKLEAEMFIPPLGFDVSNPFCKTGFIGTVFAEFSVDQGQSWTVLQGYDPAIYRSSTFFPISLEVSVEGWTNKTRFRFKQPIFESARDGWALDNVKVLRYLPNDWHNKNAPFGDSLDTALDEVQLAQCCADTDWCEQRIDNADMDEKCSVFPWYKGQSYLIRLSEILVCVATLINIIKFLYISAQNWFMKREVPFQEEFVEFLLWDRVYSLIPIAYRPRKSRRTKIEEIHFSARLEAKMRAEFNDEEGKGEIKKREELIQQERHAEMKKIRKQKKKLEERMKKKNFRETSLETSALQREVELGMNSTTNDEHKVMDFVDPDDDWGVNFKHSTVNKSRKPSEAVKQAGINIIDDKEKFKRQNIALLRIPFEIEVDDNLRNSFAAVSISLFTVFFLFDLSYSKSFVIREPITAYGSIEGSLLLDSYLLIFFAAYCDLKELYNVIKNIIPLRDKWLPTVTVDLSEEVKALFIDNVTVPLASISEFNSFPELFMRLCLAAYAAGAFPWCLFATFLRDQYLSFPTMRIISPFLGTMIILRAILGPSFLIKIVLSLKHLFEPSFKSREVIGRAFQTEKTRDSAVVTGLSLTAIALFIFSVAAFNYLQFIVPAAFVGGSVYGAVTGCIHNLPIKPWMSKYFALSIIVYLLHPV